MGPCGLPAMLPAGAARQNTDVRPVTGLALAHLRDLLARHGIEPSQGIGPCRPGTSGPSPGARRVSARTTCRKSKVSRQGTRRRPGARENRTPGGGTPRRAARSIGNLTTWFPDR
jgi:hypothetical protein